MKLIINYDILEKINVAKTGMNLNRAMKDTGHLLLAYAPFNIGINLLQNTPEEMIPEFLCAVGMFSFIHTFPCVVLAKPQKEKATRELKILVTDLEKINIYTTKELLLDSKKYKTEYELINDENEKKQIKQNKYILVPTKNEDEISVLQEHIVGSEDYSLSIGEPKKVYKLAPIKNPA